jgi:hypothetical protein
MTPERKAQSSRIMKLKWKKAEKYAIILKAPKEEVFNNLDLCIENSKGLLSYRPDIIAKVLKEGRWKEPFDEVSYWAKINEQREKNIEISRLEIDKHNEAIKRKNQEKYLFEQQRLDQEIKDESATDSMRKIAAQEKYDREKAENLGYKYKIETKTVNIKTEKLNGNAFAGLKCTMWWVDQVGGIENAERLFQAVKLSIETVKKNDFIS